MSSEVLAGTVYECEDDIVLVTLIHDGGHSLPGDAARLIAAFFGQF